MRRYDLEDSMGYFGYMEENTEGRFVKYEDLKTLVRIMLTEQDQSIILLTEQEIEIFIQLRI